jgi:hypothetical protein
MDYEPELKYQIEKLHKLTVYGRWLFVFFCWLTLGSLGFWGLREQFSLWREYFTWSAVRITIEFSPLPSFAIIFCLAITISLLVWQGKNILQGGLSPRQRYYLEQQTKKILTQGPTHPLWKWIKP